MNRTKNNTFHWNFIRIEIQMKISIIKDKIGKFFRKFQQFKKDYKKLKHNHLINVYDDIHLYMFNIKTNIIMILFCGSLTKLSIEK